MIGLAILFVSGLYLIITFLVVTYTSHYAKQNGKHPVIWGFIALFVMYNIPFWNVIPSYIAYHYYYKPRAGFWVYKTPEQWKKDNPGVAETLTWSEKLGDQCDLPGANDCTMLNERIAWATRFKNAPVVDVIIQEDVIFDVQTKELLAQKKRLGNKFCFNTWDVLNSAFVARCQEDDAARKKFFAFLDNYERIGRKKP